MFISEEVDYKVLTVAIELKYFDKKKEIIANVM